MGLYCSKCGISKNSHYVHLNEDRKHCRFHKFVENNNECLHCSSKKNEHFNGCYHKWVFKICQFT